MVSRSNEEVARLGDFGTIDDIVIARNLPFASQAVRDSLT
jgi:hypothetical protein